MEGQGCYTCFSRWFGVRSFVKPQRCKVVDNLFSSLGLDKAEWLEDIRKGSCSLT